MRKNIDFGVRSLDLGNIILLQNSYSNNGAFQPIHVGSIEADGE